MVTKIVVILFASLAVTMAYPALPINDFADQLQSAPAQSFQYAQRAVDDVVNRLSNAYVNTYDEQQNSVGQTLESVKNMGQKGVESGVNLLKSGLDFIFLIPRFGRHALAKAQQQQQHQFNQQY